MITSRFDHLVVAASSLSEGVDWLEQRLGVTVSRGGKHPKMSTHNALLRVGRDCYLEIIAIDPDAEPPPRARWFALDDPAMQATLAESPRLLTWVISCNDIDALVNAADVDMGQPVAMTRGDLKWRFALPEDGHLLEGGLVPYAIEWQLDKDQPRVAERIPESDCRIVSLDLHHPDSERLTSVLAAIDADHLVSVNRHAGEPRITARFQTPTGECQL